MERTPACEVHMSRDSLDGGEWHMSVDKKTFRIAQIDIFRQLLQIDHKKTFRIDFQNSSD